MGGVGLIGFVGYVVGCFCFVFGSCFGGWFVIFFVLICWLWFGLYIGWYCFGVNLFCLFCLFVISIECIVIWYFLC